MKGYKDSAEKLISLINLYTPYINDDKETQYSIYYL